MRNPDGCDCMVAATCVRNTVLLVSLTCVAEIATLVGHNVLRLLVDGAINEMVLFGPDMLRFFRIYSIPSHSNMWRTNTSPFGQINEPI